MSSNPPKFNFGGPPSTSSPSIGGLFGASNPPANNLVGGGSTAQPAGGNIFGGGDAGKPTGSGFSFAGFGASSAGETKPSNGAASDNKPSGGFGSFGAGSGTPSFGGLGGSQTPQKPAFGASSASGPGEGNGFFGSVSTGGTTSSAPNGSTTPAPSGFPFNPTTTPAGPPPTNLFGGTTGANNLFGNKDKDKLAANSIQPSAASSSTGQPSASGGSLFGGDKAKQSLPTFNWGKPAETSQGATSATNTNAEPQKPLFGGLGQSMSNTISSTTPTPEPQKPLFGGIGQNTSSTSSSSAPSTSSAAPSLFFQPPTSSVSSDNSKPFQFPSSTPSSTGAATSDAEKFKPLFGATPSSQTPATSAPTFGNLFNKTPTTSSATPSANVFSLGVTTPATSSSQTPASSSAAAAPTASSSAPFGSLFKVPDKPASATTTTSTSQPATTAATATAPAPTSTAAGTGGGLGTSVLGASTAGPAPSAQSRLRNKTMDEILTRWASDLTKYTKEFQSQAETVAHWDQLLVENMSKISKLYVSAVTAEKQTASVEMQLSAVENQQNELESWLTKYEGEVDEMLAKNGAGQGMELGGPDQERERTYKLAEKLSERLEDMGRDLGSMIEEINAANAGLSKTTKADEPITQIVRILNSHLSQLQAIDQGTVALQAKVNAAQQASQNLGFPGINGSNGTGNGASDGFYRSYMGRR